MKFNHIPVQQIHPLKVKITPKGRYYYFEPDLKFPSITTILGATGDKTWLKDWQKAIGNSKADKETKRCADRGEAVHLMCEHYLNNSENYENNHTPFNIKLFNKLKLKLKKINNIKAQEIALYSTKLGIAGRTDCIGEYNGVLSVIDFKTSNNIKTEEMIKDYFLQCSFYAIAYNEMYNTDIKQLVVMIAVEKSMVPQIFVKKINKEYILGLLKKIKEFNK